MLGGHHSTEVAFALLTQPSRFESQHSRNFLTVEISSAVKREKVLLRQWMVLEPIKSTTYVRNRVLVKETTKFTLVKTKTGFFLP